MKNALFIFTFFIINISFSQTINFEEIKKNVINPDSPLYYTKLVKEFEFEPSAFRGERVKTQYLYYGKLYSSYYKKGSEVKSDYLKFIKQTSTKKYSKAIILGEELLKKDPVNLIVIMNLITCYKNKEENEERRKKLEIQAEILLTTIADSGDGKGKETSFEVISLGDEFALLSYFNIKLNKYTRTSETLREEFILDIWTKDEKYTNDHRNKIYITVVSANSKIPK